MTFSNWIVNKTKENDFSISQDNDFKLELNNNEFNNFLSSLKCEPTPDQISNATKLLENYRTILNFISGRAKVGALTEIENLVNKTLGK